MSRLHCPTNFRDEVLARLPELNEQRYKEKLLAGKAISGVRRRGPGIRETMTTQTRRPPTKKPIPPNPKRPPPGQPPNPKPPANQKNLPPQISRKWTSEIPGLALRRLHFGPGVRDNRHIRSIPSHEMTPGTILMAYWQVKGII